MSERIRFARRVSLKVKPERVDEFVSAMRERIYPGLSKENGMRRIYLLRDATNPNEFVSLTLWDSRGEAEAYGSTGHFSANTDLVREYLQDDPMTSQFEVEYHTVSPSVPPPSPARKRARKATRARRPAKRRRRR